MLGHGTFSFYTRCLGAIAIIYSCHQNVALVSATSRVSIWNTNAMNDVFCDHLINSASPQYHIWFSKLGNSIRENIQGIAHHQITNVYLQKPSIHHCHGFYINLIIETSYDAPTLRFDLQQWARSLKLITHHDFNVILKLYTLGEIAQSRESLYGIYIVQNQLVTHFHMTQGEIMYLMEIARKCRIHVTKMWKDNERTYILVRNNSSNNNLFMMIDRFRHILTNGYHHPFIISDEENNDSRRCF